MLSQKIPDFLESAILFFYQIGEKMEIVEKVYSLMSCYSNKVFAPWFCEALEKYQPRDFQVEKVNAHDFFI